MECYVVKGVTTEYRNTKVLVRLGPAPGMNKVSFFFRLMHCAMSIQLSDVCLPSY